LTSPNQQPHGAIGSPQDGFDHFWSNSIAALPQRASIRRDDAQAWYASAAADPFKDFNAHYQDLLGFTAVDIGIILADRLNVPTWFSDLPTLVEEKLLRRRVAPTRFDRIEGAAMEPVLRDLFRTATDALDAPYSLKRPQFVVGSPEDVLRIGNETVLVGYRHLPDRTPPELDDIPFALVAMLTHYRKMIDIKIDRSLIVFSDKNSPCGFTALEVPPLSELDEAWEAALNDVRTMVLEGKIPPRRSQEPEPEAEWQNLSPDLRDKIDKLEKEYVVSDLLRRETYNAFRNAKAALAEAFRTSNVPMSKWVPRITTAILRQEVDDALAQEMLRVLQLDEAEYRRRGDANVDALVEALSATHEGLKRSLKKITRLIAVVDQNGPAETLAQIKTMLLRISDALQSLPSEPDSETLFSRVWDAQKLSVVARRYQIPSPVNLAVSPTYAANASLGITPSDIETNREIARQSLRALTATLREVLFSEGDGDDNVARESVQQCTESLQYILLNSVFDSEDKNVLAMF
jgi:hypothetical protein